MFFVNDENEAASINRRDLTGRHQQIQSLETLPRSQSYEDMIDGQERARHLSAPIRIDATFCDFTNISTSGLD